MERKFKREPIERVLSEKGWKFDRCPFCSSIDIGVKENLLDAKAGEGPCASTKRIWAYCRYCGAEGRKKTADVIGTADEIAVAIKGWNFRKGADKVSRNAVLDCIVRFSQTSKENCTELIHDINELTD